MDDLSNQQAVGVAGSVDCSVVSEDVAQVIADASSITWGTGPGTSPLPAPGRS